MLFLISSFEVGFMVLSACETTPSSVLDISSFKAFLTSKETSFAGLVSVFFSVTGKASAGVGFE